MQASKRTGAWPRSLCDEEGCKLWTQPKERGGEENDAGLGLCGDEEGQQTVHRWKAAATTAHRNDWTSTIWPSAPDHHS